jgi:hypothetical protein
MNAGSFGEGIAASELLNMKTTANMEGLSIAFSCTHKSPI